MQKLRLESARIPVALISLAFVLCGNSRADVPGQDSQAARMAEISKVYSTPGWSSSSPGGALPAPPQGLPQQTLGGAPNLKVNSVWVADSNGDPTTPVIGQPFWVRVNYSYSNPTCTPYSIERTVNGWTHTSPTVTWGCGGTGTSHWWHYWGSWFVHSQATIPITVSLDPNNAIAESDESDNTMTVFVTFATGNIPEWDLVNVDAGRTLLGDGTGVIVGSMDDSMDFSHPLLSGNASDGSPRLVAASQNTLGAGGSPQNAGHATAVMGIVLARPVAPGDYEGMAPDARYVTSEFLNRAGISGLNVLDVRDAAGFLVTHGAEVINMSWSWWFGSRSASESGDSPITALMTDYLAWNRNIVCVPAVNQLGGHTVPTAPGSARNAITIGGLDSDLVHAWAAQDHGPTSDGRSKPDLLGNSAVNSYVLRGGWESGFPSSRGYNGTSFATPFVTGAVAQMLDYGKANGESLDHRVIKAIIMNSGRHTVDSDGSAWSNSSTLPLDDEQGTGILDMVRVHAMYAGGEQNTSSIQLPGYDLDTIYGSVGPNPDEGMRVYRLGNNSDPLADLAITLAFDRHAYWSDGNSNGQIDSSDTFFLDPNDVQDDLNLFLYKDGQLFASSQSSIDTIEHLSLEDIGIGDFELVVERLHVADSGDAEEYAIAFDTNGNWTPSPVVGTAYCDASVNSTGSAAAIHGMGSSSVAANDLSLSAQSVPDSVGVFFYGAGSVQAPLGNGTLCVSAPIGRVGTVVGVAGQMNWTLDNTAPPTPTTRISAGSTWYFQCWFRDPFAGGAMSNLSNALAVTFVP